jgi:hypothetical protein
MRVNRLILLHLVERNLIAGSVIEFGGAGGFVGGKWPWAFSMVPPLFR